MDAALNPSTTSERCGTCGREDCICPLCAHRGAVPTIDLTDLDQRVCADCERRWKRAGAENNLRHDGYIASGKVGRRRFTPEEAILAKLAGEIVGAKLAPKKCDWCDKARELHDVRPDVYSTSVYRVCDECDTNGEPEQLPTIGAALALLVEVSAIETAIVTDITEDDSGAYSVSSRGRIGPFDLAAATAADDGFSEGFSTWKVIGNGMPRGRKVRGITDHQRIRAIIDKAGPRFTLAEHRYAATKRGPANGTLAALQDFNRIVFECDSAGINKSALAKLYELPRGRIYKSLREKRTRLVC